MGPIGVFDSGYGGLTVLKEIREKLPVYDYLYLGDNARAPYGTRSFDVVYEYTLEAVQELFNRGCELVIIACNTASAKALRTIQQNDLENIDPSKRVLGVIRPTTEIVGQYSSTKNIGILATPGTVQSSSYTIEINKFSPECKVFQQACPMWVPLIENNEFNSEAGRMFIESDVKKLLEQQKNIDTIILGCTHFPIVEDIVKEIVGKGVTVLSQGAIVASSLSDYLLRHPIMNSNCSKSGSVHYLTTENPHLFNERASIFLDEEINSSHLHY